jgi:RNA recognition motif-containing protein
MNIFVAKLNSRTTSETLNEVFSSFGEVTSAKIIIDRETGNSKQFGFVEMRDDTAALSAIEKLDGSQLDGSRIVVKQSVPREEGKSSGGNNKYGNRNREYKPRPQSGGYDRER